MGSSDLRALERAPLERHPLPLDLIIIIIITSHLFQPRRADQMPGHHIMGHVLRDTLS